MTPEVTAVVLCGGTSRRMGGGDKTALMLAGRTVLDHVLAGIPADWPVICVGEPRAVTLPGGETSVVQWTREEPPLGGPVAGLDAALVLVDTPTVVVLAGDQPLAGAAAVLCATGLAAAGAEVDAVWPLPELDPSEAPRGQPLPAAYRTAALRHAVAGRRDVGLYATLGGLRIQTLTLPADLFHDLDEPADLQVLEAQRSSSISGAARERP